MESFDATFNCNGKVNVNDWRLNDSNFFMKKDVDKVLSDNVPHCNTNFKIFNCETTGTSILLKLQHFSRCLESKLKQIERYEKMNSFHETSDSNKITNIYSLRKSICEFVYHLRNYLKTLKAETFALKDINDGVESDFNDLLSTILKFLSRLKYIPASTFLYVSSPSGNKCTQPEYHVYHIHLDLRWLLTTLICVKSDQWDYSIESSEDLKNIIYNTIGDLIYISLQIFESIPNSELRRKTPYSCTCLRELYLSLQILTDELSKKNTTKNFWDYVNLILNEFMENLPDKKRHKNLSTCKNPEVFCTWLIYHLILLYKYDSNGSYLDSPSNRYQQVQRISNTRYMEKMLKAYVNKSTDSKGVVREDLDEELCVIIPLLQVLAIEWWQSDFQLIELILNCFHRRLNKPFLMQVRGPWISSSEKKTPMDLLDNVKNRLKQDNETSEESSFGLFLRLFGTFLKKNCSSPESKLWLNIKVRIFIKFPRLKVYDYSEAGLYNYLSLYLTLAVVVDPNGILADLQLAFPADDYKDRENGKKLSLIWKNMLAFLLLFNDQNLSLKEIASYFSDVADRICCSKEEYAQSMMVWYIDVLRIIATRVNSFECHEDKLLGGWINRYLEEIAPNRCGVVVSTILKIWEKCTSTDNRHIIGNTLVRNCIWTNAVSRVRMMVIINEDLNTNLYEMIAKLGVYFTIEGCNGYTSGDQNHSPVKLLQHFTSSPILKDLRITKLYLQLILQNEFIVEYFRKDKEMKDFDLFCVQLWIKCNILTKDQHESDHFLKNYIANILTMREIMCTDADYNEFLQSNEPLTSFLVIVLRKRNTMKSERDQIIFDNKCRSFLLGIERWILQLITEENKDSRNSIWTYHCVGLIIKHWAQILYSKDQSMLRNLITKIALPPTERMNLFYRMHLFTKIFSTIILSMENLNVSTDISLQSTMKDLFERYLPQLVTQADDNDRCYRVSHLLLECFTAKPDFIQLIFFILGSNMIIIPKDQETHPSCYLVMFLIMNLIGAGTLYKIDVVNSIVHECGERIFHCYCLVHESHPHRKHTMDFLREITANSYYKESSPIREKLKSAIWNVLKKNTTSHPTASFDLLNYIFRINKELYKFLYTHMEAFVTTCEKTQISNAGTLRFQFNSMKKI